MSHTAVNTPGVSASLRTSLIAHEVALFGCSCRKCLPPSSCIRYNSTQNLTCLFATSIFIWNSSSSRLDLLRFCRLLNIVHGGLPISMNGFESRTNPLTRALTSFLLKSHGLPVSGSLRVRSRLHPGFNVVPPYVLRAASCTILGCEYTSDTSAPISSYSLRAPSIVSSTLMSSALFMRLCNSLLGVSLTMQSSMILPVVRLLVILL